MVDEKIKAVEADPNITVKTETVVARIAGQPGNLRSPQKTGRKDRIRRTVSPCRMK
jgi:hypothetical protein